MYDFIASLKLTEWLGIWGALLSSYTALNLFFSGRPVFNPEPCKSCADTEDDQKGTKLNLRISNPSQKLVMQIVDILVLPKKLKRRLSIEQIGPKSRSSSEVSDDVCLDLGRGQVWKETGYYPIYLKPSSDALLQIKGITPDTKGILVFGWHRHGLMFRTPSFVQVSWKMASEVNKGFRHA